MLKLGGCKGWREGLTYAERSRHIVATSSGTSPAEALSQERARSCCVSGVFRAWYIVRGVFMYSDDMNDLHVPRALQKRSVMTMKNYHRTLHRHPRSVAVASAEPPMLNFRRTLSNPECRGGL